MIYRLEHSSCSNYSGKPKCERLDGYMINWEPIGKPKTSILLQFFLFDPAFSFAFVPFPLLEMSKTVLLEETQDRSIRFHNGLRSRFGYIGRNRAAREGDEKIERLERSWPCNFQHEFIHQYQWCKSWPR